MKFGQLIDCCIDIINTFNPIVQTLDSYADQYLAKFEDAYERMFIKQVFYGCIRYEQLLKSFNNVLFRMKSAQTNRKDATLFSIFGYISLFRLDDLNPQDFKRLVLSQDNVKMNVFLQFLFNVENLKTNVRDEWMKFFDYQYIDQKLIGGIQKNIPNYADLLYNIEKKATGAASLTHVMSAATSFMDGTAVETGTIRSGMKSALEEEDEAMKRKKHITVPEPFNITKPKPRAMPVLEEIPKVIKRREVPKSLYKKDLKAIEAEKKERRDQLKKETEQKFQGERNFSFATHYRPSNLEVTKRKVEEQRDKEIQFNKKHSKPMPNFDQKKAVVKLNKGAVIREGYLLQKKKEDDQRVAKEFEMNLRDASEYDRWRREMEEQDNIKRLEHIQKQKIEMELAREEAINAKQHKLKENQLLVAQMREISGIELDEMKVKVKVDMMKRKDVAEEIKDARVNVQIEQEKVKKKKKEIKQELDKEIEDALERKRQEDMVALKRREEIIRQIYEMERVKIDRTKRVDKDTVYGYGLLDELSLNQLEERLAENKRKFQQEAEERKEKILKEKEEDANKLMDEAKKVMDERERKKEENEQRKLDKIREAKEKKQKIDAAREKGLLEVFDRISDKKKRKKEEEERLAKELKEIKLQRQYLNASKAMVEEKAWKELESAKERQIKDGQNERLINQNLQNEIKMKELTIRAQNAKSAVREKATHIIMYNNNLEEKVKLKEREHKEDVLYKEKLHTQQRDFEKTLLQNRNTRLPYSAKMNETQKQLATTFIQEKTVKLSEKKKLPGVMHDSTLPPISEAFEGGKGANIFEDEGNEPSLLEKKLAQQNI